MDRLWSALVTNRPQSALLIPVSQSEIAHEVKTIFEELECSKLGRCGGQPETWETVMGLTKKSSSEVAGAVRPVSTGTKKRQNF